MINKQKKKKQINNSLLNTLFKSKNFYGEVLNQTHKEVLPFIYGIRHNYSIINLKNTSLFLKRIFKLIKFTIYKKKKILIVGNSDDIKFLINENLTKKNPNLIFYNQEWIHGLITNNNIKTFFRKNEIQLILIIKSSINSNFLKTELLTLQVPIISFINTNQDLKNIHYPVLMNSKNIKSIFSLLYFIRQLF